MTKIVVNYMGSPNLILLIINNTLNIYDDLTIFPFLMQS